ncbi:MAG: calcium/sodium antiporter [Candidatus Thorarchaeota archaeon]|jgi:cation:H+ antiporter
MQLDLILLNIGIFVIGLVFLAYGSDVFVESASKLALSIGVSELFIGLTIVAIGTSLPEVVASTTAVIAGQSQLAFTNIIGSTIVNMTLIIGVSAIVSPLASNAVVIDRDAKVMIFILGALAFFFFDPFTPGAVVSWEAIALLVLFIAYLSFLFTRREECESCYQFRIFVDYLIRFQFLTSLGGLISSSRGKTEEEVTTDQADVEQVDEDSKPKTLRNSLTVVMAALLIVLGAQFVVIGSEFITLTWGIEPGVIGFTIIALGTSLPELTVSINSARRGFGRLLIGNVIGSNIINITLGVGIVSLFIPMTIELVLGNTIIILLTLVLALIFFYAIRRDWRVTKREGVILIALFVLAQIITIYFEQFAV